VLSLPQFLKQTDQIHHNPQPHPHHHERKAKQMPTEQPNERLESEFIQRQTKKLDWNYECQNALLCLAQFAAWWTDFQKSDCDGIKASFEIKDARTVEFQFQKDHYRCKLVYDLFDALSDANKIRLDFEVAMWKLRGTESLVSVRVERNGENHFCDSIKYTHVLDARGPGVGKPPTLPPPRKREG
jgi:hypothetical protein